MSIEDKKKLVSEISTLSKDEHVEIFKIIRNGTDKYTKKRNYLFGYLSTLRSLEKRGDIKILQEQRTFGGQYHEGYSFVVWKPM